MNKTKEKKLMIAKGIVAFVFLLMLIVYILTAIGRMGERKINKLLDLGNKYMEDMDYESAVLVFDQVIAIDSKCEDAYWGKAQAQYVLGQYENAIATLEEGIIRVDDSSRLERFLQQILEEMTEGERQETSIGSVEAENRIEKTLTLNYIEIVRFVDTQEPEIQLEILGDEGNEDRYSWKNSNSECVDVSLTGLVTCKPVKGTAVIYAEDEYGNKSGECMVSIYSSDDGYIKNEWETIKIRTDTGNEGKEQDYVVLINEKDDEESAIVDVLGRQIYYSGDITIPETLQFRGKEIKITGLSSRAFRWSDKLNSIYIPAAIEDMGIREYETVNPFYYCTNLKEIKTDENSEFFKVDDGVLYSKDGRILYSYPARKEGSSYTLPKEVEKVCQGAFLGCGNLKEILVEEGNKHYVSVDGSLIEKDGGKLVAYPVGNGLTSYTVPDNVKYLDSNVFYSSILEEINCNSVERIQEDAFRQCDKLERIGGGEKTTDIYWGSEKEMVFTGFSTMKNLSSLTIPLSEEQDISEFINLKNLNRLEISANGYLFDLGILSEFPKLSNLKIKGMDKIEDLSWMEGMNSLHSLELIAKEFNVTDLTPLFSLDNLQFIRIDNYGVKNELSDDVKQQIEEFKAQNPEMNVYIWE